MEVRNYSLRFGERQLADAINIKLTREQLNVVTGANGSGKSSLLDFMAGIGPKSAYGEKIDLPRSSEIAYQLQKTHFFPTLTVAQTIQMFRDLSHAAVESSDPVFQKLKSAVLDPIWSTQMGQLSGGEQQMVLTYGHCLLDKTLYLFDEPTSGVDVAHAQMMMQLIHRLVTERGKTVVLIAHHLAQLDGMVYNRIQL